MRDFRSLWQELKRRRVWRAAAVHGAVSWGALQLANVVWEPLGLPEWTMTLVIVLAGLGFSLVLTVQAEADPAALLPMTIMEARL